MTARIAFTGDIMCPPGLTEMIVEKTGKRDYSSLFAGIERELRAADVLVGNLETPLAGEDMLFTHERYCFNTPDEFGEMLKDYGFGLLCLANNHCMDRGEKGIIRTLGALDRIGVAHTGLYRDESERKPTVVEANGIRIGIVNCTYGTNAFAHHNFLSARPSPMVNLTQPEETLPGSIHLLEPMERIAELTAEYYSGRSGIYGREISPYLERLKGDFAAAKAVSDVVIAVMHSGGQYNPEPDAYTLNLARTLREYGADAIVGHHPHVIHRSGIEDGVFTAYSLGNLFCLPSQAQDRAGSSYSAILTLTVGKDGEKASITGADFALTYTAEPDGELPYCVNAAEAPDVSEALYYASKFAGTEHKGIKESYTIFGNGGNAL